MFITCLNDTIMSKIHPLYSGNVLGAGEKEEESQCLSNNKNMLSGVY